MEECQKIFQLKEGALGSSRLKYDISLMQTTTQTKQSSLVQTNWPSLHSLIAHRRPDDPRKYAFMSFVTSMGWSKSIDLPVLQCLCLIFTTRAVADVLYPAALTLDLSPVKGRKPTQNELIDIIKPQVWQFDYCPESSMVKSQYQSRRDRDRRAKELYQTNTTAAVNSLVQALLRQWPVAKPVLPPGPDKLRTYINVKDAMQTVSKLFRACYDNMLFSNYLSLLEDRVASLPLASTNELVCVKLDAVPLLRSTTAYVSNEELFLSPDQHTMQRLVSPVLTLFPVATVESAPAESSCLLSNLVAKLDASPSRPPFELKYIAELQESIVCLRSYDGDIGSRVDVTQEEAIEYQKNCANHVARLYDTMVTATTSGLSDLTLLSRDVQQWPRVSPLFFLQQLRHGALQTIPSQWKTCIIEYGLAITALQRATRIAKLAEYGTSVELTQELQNIGHENWQPEEFPSSL